MDMKEKLERAGLTGNEAEVYLELVKKGELPANKIARSISMDRTLTYTVLNHLIDKGQVNYVKKKGKKFFSASNPENLLNPIKTKEHIVKSLIEDLKNIEKEDKQETGVEVYEGKEGIRHVIRESLEAGHFDSFGSTGRIYDFLIEAPALGKEAKKKGVTGRIIIGEKYGGHEYIGKYDNLETRFLNVNTEATTTIVDDKIIIHLIRGKPVIVVIQNKHIAESYRNYFEWMWQKAKEVD